MPPTQSADVIIVGGGPAGLIAGIELGRRGVRAMVFDPSVTAPSFPKANATTSRTMEHYRRLGFVREIRELGLPLDYPQDISYLTRLTKYELARLKGLSRRQAMTVREGAHSRWPTPEPLHRTQQMYIEGVMRREVARYPSITTQFGWRVTKVEQDDATVTVEALEVASNRTAKFTARYVVGCEGARSVVREAMGVQYEGIASEERDFLGGRMLAVYIKAPAFYDVVCTPPAWLYYSNNRERRGVYGAIDGQDLFVAHFQLAKGARGSLEFANSALAQSMGCEWPYQIIGMEEWTAGFTLVAERFKVGRAFVVGDAAHLFTPTGGQGYNTSVDDASNLGWKLAAVCQGWGDARLLDSYEAERQPIARRNTTFARAMADSIGRTVIPANIEDDTAAGQATRKAFGEQLINHSRTEFDIPGIHFGMFYGSSPVIAGDGSPPPLDRWNEYVPNATPGARAPHVWLDQETALFDRFGRDFTLLRFGSGSRADTQALEAAAMRRGVALAVVDIDSTEARDLYARNLVLVRPDQHVAWRGNALPADSADLIAKVTGATA